MSTGAFRFSAQKYTDNTYSVAHAEYREVGEEWNDVVWDSRHFQIQYHRLYLLTSGTAKIRLIDREVELVPGRVYFIPAYSVANSHIDGKMEKYYIHFQVDSPLCEMYRYLTDSFSVPALPETEFLFRTVLDSFSDGSHAARMRVQGAMNMIMSDFAREMSLESNVITRFEPVLTYINGHFAEDISLAYLAELMNISKMYFSNYFKRVFNVSPKQYILGKRLTESQRLLLETNMSVKEIAYAVGFENENYFSEFFTAKVGISALKFRNRELPDKLVK